MSRLMETDLTPERYARTLAELHALYVPLEAALTRVPGLRDVVPDLDRRFKTASLRADLDALGTPPAPVKTVSAIDDVPTALGTLYVLEGSTMGGRLIANALRQRAFVRPESLHFFEHYGAEAGRHWQAFVKTLEDVAPDHYPAVITAATTTFAYFLDLGANH